MLDTRPPHPNQESNENKRQENLYFLMFFYLLFFSEQKKEQVGDEDRVESRGGYERIKSEKRDKRSRLLGSGESDRT